MVKELKNFNSTHTRAHAYINNSNSHKLNKIFFHIKNEPKCRKNVDFISSRKLGTW